MNFKRALETIEASTEPVKSTFIQLTNPFRYEKEVKEESKAQQLVRIQHLAKQMRQQWEAFHDENGTWYDYSDNESLFSDSEDEDEYRECDEDYDE